MHDFAAILSLLKEADTNNTVMEEEKKDKEKVTDEDDVTEENVTHKDDITGEKVTPKDDITEEKVTHKDEVRETSPVPDKPPVIRLPCCPMRKYHQADAHLDLMSSAGPEGSGQGVRTPLKNHKNTWFCSNNGPDPLKNSKLPSQHSMLGPSSPLQRNSLAGR